MSRGAKEFEHAVRDCLLVAGRRTKSDISIGGLNLDLYAEQQVLGKKRRTAVECKRPGRRIDQLDVDRARLYFEPLHRDMLIDDALLVGASGVSPGALAAANDAGWIYCISYSDLVDNLGIRYASKKVVLVASAFDTLSSRLAEDESQIYKLTPDEFEVFLCERLEGMGLAPVRTGSAYARDGGVDIIACPAKPVSVPFLLAVQAKHQRSAKGKVGPEPVKAFHSVLAVHPFTAGLLVTNTTFSPDAQWIASYLSDILRLRDITDLRRWIADRFLGPEEWREIPDKIELAPSLEVPVPKPQILPDAHG